MKKMSRATRSVVLGLAAVALLSVVGVSSAMAVPTLSTWSPVGAAKAVTTSIVVKRNGLQPLTCTPTGTPAGTVYNSPTPLGQFYTNAFTPIPSYRFACPNGTTFAMYLYLAPYADGAVKSVKLQSMGAASSPTPYNGEVMYQDLPNVFAPYTNGSGATPSKITFSDTIVGRTGPALADRISITGTFNVTTSTGGLLTIN